LKITEGVPGNNIKSETGGLEIMNNITSRNLCYHSVHVLSFYTMKWEKKDNEGEKTNPANKDIREESKMVTL
jgi:hypothetical protein